MTDTKRPREFIAKEFVDGKMQDVLYREVVPIDETCKHPGCCCVCGHRGECPEDGPSFVEGITD